MKLFIFLLGFLLLSATSVVYGGNKPYQAMADFEEEMMKNPVHVPLIVSSKPETVIQILSEDLIRTASGRYRLMGVKVPKSMKGAAKTYLKQKIQGKKVILERDHVDEKTKAIAKRTGNKYAYVFIVGETISINERMIQRGLAKIDQEFPFRLSTKFMDYQDEAARDKVGVWANS